MQLTRDAELNQIAVDRGLYLENCSFIGVALKGDLLSDVVTTMLLPLAGVEEQLLSLRKHAAMLCCESTTGRIVYANAGACSPVIVDVKDGSAKEVTLSAPVLGGFKNSKFTEIELAIEPGQAMVFYTDGIIEALNPQGQEIGYEGFKQILLESFDSDATTYYSNIYQRYLAWLQGGRPQDDLTLIIMVRL